MDTIPAEYWMVILTVLVGFICFVLYELAMLLRESKGAVSDSRRIMVEAESTLGKANALVDTATEIVNSVKGSVEDITDFVGGPLRRIGSVLAVIGGFVGGAKAVKK
jgi:hypothetical protein